MREVEQPALPEWARRERAVDLRWLQENLHILWPAADQSYKEQGRGAIVVDTMSRPTGAGNPFYYLPAESIAALHQADAVRMVNEYDASWELVAMLLKPAVISTYRVGVPAARENHTR